MAHAHEKALKKAVDLLKQTNDAIKEMLSHNDLMSIRAFTETNTLKNINYLGALMGNAPELGDIHKLADYGPVTQFFGKEISRERVITKADLTPQQQEKLRFFAERDSLYEQFLTLTDDQLINKCNQPGGENIIRSIAKKIGMDNYKKRPVDILMFEDIRTHIREETEENTKLRDAEQGLKGGTSFVPKED